MYGCLAVILLFAVIVIGGHFATHFAHSIMARLDLRTLWRFSIYVIFFDICGSLMGFVLGVINRYIRKLRSEPVQSLISIVYGIAITLAAFIVMVAARVLHESVQETFAKKYYGHGIHPGSVQNLEFFFVFLLGGCLSIVAVLWPLIAVTAPSTRPFRRKPPADKKKVNE